MDDSNTSQAGVMPWTLVGGASAMQQPVFIMAPPPLINMGTGTPPTEVGGGLAAMIPQFLPPGFTLAYPSSHLMDNSAQDPSPTSPSPSPPSHHHQRSSGADRSSPNPRPGVISPPLATADGSRDKASERKQRKHTESKAHRQPVHVSVVSPKATNSGHQWAGPTASGPHKGESQPTKRSSVIMGVSSPPPTHNEDEPEHELVPFGSPAYYKMVAKTEDAEGEVQDDASHQAAPWSEGTARTGSGLVWSPPQGGVTKTDSGHVQQEKQEDHSHAVHTPVSHTPRLLGGPSLAIHSKFLPPDPKVDLRKRRGKKPTDIEAFLVPLRKGWRRETMIRSHTKADVCYTTPCGRRLRAYQEVTRYLELNAIQDLTVDNFSFSTKILVGQFLEAQGDGSSWRVLTDNEVAAKNLTVDKRLLGCRKRRADEPVAMTATHELEGDVIVATPTHSPPQQAGSPSNIVKGVEAPPTGAVAGRADMQPLQEASHIASEELVGGGHTTIVTIAPTTEVHTREPVGLSSRVETPTVVIDGVSSSGSTDALGVMATTVGGPSSSSAPSNDSGQMVVYPRKRGRKRKSDLGGHSSTPIHVPRQRGSAPLVLESQEQSTPKRRGRPPKALSQSMQAMTSQFEAHSMQQVPDVGVAAASAGPDVGYTVPVAQKGLVQKGLTQRSGDSQMASAGVHPPAVARKRVGRPRKVDAELRKKEVVRWRAEKVRKKAEKVAQEKVLRRQMKKQIIEMEQKRKAMADLTAKRREADDLERRRSRVLRFQWQELRRRQLEHSQHLVERNRQSQMDYRARLEQQKREFEIQYQLKKPVEDLVLKGMPSLPSLPVLPTFRLTPTAFAQAQVVFEFMAAFSDFLRCDNLPTFTSLCASLHNVNPEVFYSALSVLLGALLRDRAGKLCTASGWAVKDMDVTAGTAAELFRILATSCSTLPSKIADIVVQLGSQPVSALQPSQKAAILGFLTDELLESPSLVKEIDSRMELMSVLRREKWKVNLKLKRFRTVFNREHITAEELVAMAKPPPYKGRGRPPKRPQVVAVEGGDSSDDDETQDGDGDGEDMTMEEDVPEGVSPEQSDEEMPSSREVLENRIKQMRKKQARIRSLLHRLSSRMRSFPLGCDRYTRTYWSLPSLGGVYVEGVDCYPEANLYWGAIEVESEPVEDGNHGDEMPAPSSEAEEGVVSSEGSSLTVVRQEKATQVGPEGVESVPGPSHTTTEKGGSSDSSHSVVKRKKYKPHPLVLNSDISSQQEVAMPTEGPLSPSSTPVTITIHSPTGVGTVSGTMEVVPVSTAPSQRSSVITSAVEWSKSGGGSGRVLVKEVPRPPPPLPWYDLLPRDPCSMPCNLQRLIEQCSEGKDRTSAANEAVAMETTTASGMSAGPQPEGQTIFVPEQSSGESSGAAPVMPMSQYSYMYLQTTGGDTQLCLVDNSSMPYLQSVTLHMEVPPVVAMANEAESVPHAISITVEASPLPIHHHNLQRMVVAMERGAQSTPDELLKDVAAVVKCGWRFVQKGQEVDNLIKKLSCRGYREKALYKSLVKRKDHIQEPSGDHAIERLAEATQSMARLSQPRGGSAEDSPEHVSPSSLPVVDSALPGESQVQLLEVMKEVRSIAERLVSANLQEQGQDNPTPSESGDDMDACQSNEQLQEKVQASLLAVEEAVDRQNLNPPFQGTSGGDQEEVEGGSFLSQWRQAVSMATSASQLSVCMAQLERSIAWEKSLLKVFCTVCHRAEDEACLLLCDSCDRGTHTYCCRPRLDCIPEGDWFCATCASSSAIEKKSCAECGGRRGATTSCSSCARSYHKKCLPPSAQSRSKSDKWRCPHCTKSPGMQTRNRGRGQAGSPSRGRGQTGSQSRGRGQALGRGRASSPSLGRSSPAPDKLQGDELFLCRSLVRELEKQPAAMPFRYPVSKKQFPEYYEMVQFPMDFHTIKTKLKEQRYVNRWEFAEDIELMFRNCSFFNEDTSEVGRAGQSMKKIFDEKWLEFFPPND